MKKKLQFNLTFTFVSLMMTDGDDQICSCNFYTSATATAAVAFMV